MSLISRSRSMRKSCEEIGTGNWFGMLRIDVLRQRLDEEVRVEMQEERQ